MNKIKLIKQYISEIDYCIKNGSYDDQYELQKKIIGVYVGEIEKFTQNLNTYHIRHCTQEQLTQDLKLLKSKLENYIGTLKFNHQAGGLDEIMANHPIKVLAATIIAAFGFFYGALMGIMNISNTTIVGKDNYILKTELDKQYVSREQYNTDIQKLQSDNKKLLANEIDNNSLKSEYTKGWFTRYDQLKKERDGFEKELKNLINLSSGFAGFDEAKNIEQKQELQRKIDSRNEEINILLTQLQLVNYEKKW